jgi:hypothetical protein
MCASIRSRWTPRDRQRRRVGGPLLTMLAPADTQPWLPPVIDTASLRASGGKSLRELIS